MTRKKTILMFYCEKKLEVFFSSIDGLYDDGTFKSAPKFFHQLCAIIGLTINVTLSLPVNKLPKSYEDVFRHTVSEAAKCGMNVFPTIVFDNFMCTGQCIL